MILSEFHRAAGSGRARCPDCAADCGLGVSIEENVPRFEEGNVTIFVGQVPAKWTCISSKCGWQVVGVVENLELCRDQALHGATFIPLDELI